MNIKGRCDFLSFSQYVCWGGGGGGGEGRGGELRCDFSLILPTCVLNVKLRCDFPQFPCVCAECKTEV